MAKKKKAERRGGARKGAGRKSSFGERMINCTVALPQQTIDAIQDQADAQGVDWTAIARQKLMSKT